MGAASGATGVPVAATNFKMAAMSPPLLPDIEIVDRYWRAPAPWAG